jgi:hypothetical protein
VASGGDGVVRETNGAVSETPPTTRFSQTPFGLRAKDPVKRKVVQRVVKVSAAVGAKEMKGAPARG